MKFHAALDNKNKHVYNLDCSSTPTVTAETAFYDNNDYGVNNVLSKTACEAKGDFALGKDRAAESTIFVMDIGCSDYITQIELINTHNDRNQDR